MIVAGPNPKDPSQGAATRSLLRALCMPADQAATVAGVSPEALATLLDGKAHSPLWGLLAERWCQAAGTERDQSPCREWTPTPKELRKAGIVPRKRRRAA